MAKARTPKSSASKTNTKSAAPRKRTTKKGAAKKGATTKSNPKRKPTQAAKRDDGLPIVHPSLSVGVYTEIEGEKTTPMSVERAKELLGWQPAGNLDYFGSIIKDRDGNRIRLGNNRNNRPINKANLQTLMQEMLRGNWRMNGEPIIIGRTGMILNGQHTLLAFVFAHQEIAKRAEHWPQWQNQELRLDKLVVYGIEEDDHVINTLDTAKPRSLDDVIARSSMFASAKSSDRIKLAKATARAVQMLWHRTGAKLNAFAPIRTHAESIDFIERHPRLIECVQHIHEENGTDRKISRYIGTGYASAFLYLMGCCGTEPTKYYTTSPQESYIKWTHWNQAVDFWTMMAGGATELKEYLAARVQYLNQDLLGRNETYALICKAWGCVVADKPITKAKLKLSHITNEYDVQVLDEMPTFGGIDLGDPSKQDEAELARITGGTLGATGEKPPTEEEVEQAKASAHAKKTPTVQATKGKGNKAQSKPTKNGFVNKLMWIDDPDKNPWQGRVRQVIGKNAEVQISQGFQGAGSTISVPTAWLTDQQPTAKG